MGELAWKHRAELPVHFACSVSAFVEHRLSELYERRRKQSFIKPYSTKENQYFLFGCSLIFVWQGLA